MRGRKSSWLFALTAACVALAALAGMLVLSTHGQTALEIARDLRTEARARWAPLVALLLYTGAIVVGFPSSLLTAVTMLLFGIATGGAIAYTGILVGGSVVYAVGRFAARDLVERWLARRRDAWFERLHDVLARRGFATVVLLRLTPIPYALANLALGATRIRWSHFVCGTALGILPSLAIVAAITNGVDVWLLTPDRRAAPVAAAVIAIVAAATIALVIGFIARRRASRADPQDQ